MKVVIFACLFAATALWVAGAPTPDNSDGLEEHERVVFVPQTQLRGRRHFAQPAYSPCGAPMPVHQAPAYIPVAHGGYGGGGYGGGSYGGGGGYGGGHGYGYAPHYRAEDMDTDILNFSDMDQVMSEHLPMARYGYGAAPVVHGGASLGGLSGYGQVASGPAISVFPNANTGGCNVPLLLSCSPSIVPGRLVKGYGSYGAALPVAGAVPSYRSSEHEDQNLEHEDNAAEHTQENLEPAEDSAHSNAL